MNIHEVLKSHRIYLENGGERGERANLQGANLERADLRGADLEGADLRGADLEGCVGDRNRIKSLGCFEDYPVAYTADRLQIGCKNYSIDEWVSFSDDEISKMDEGALAFWHENKQFIFLAIERLPAK